MSKFKGVRQTRTGDTGNCFQACVATVLDLPLEVVPDFCNIKDIDNWWGNFQDWLEKYQLGALNLHVKQMNELRMSAPPYKQMVILSGITSRHSKRLHSVVAEYNEDTREFEMVWDPHESEEGLVEATEILFFVDQCPDMQFRHHLQLCANCNKWFLEDEDTQVDHRGYYCSNCKLK